jgi:hypothetical protein
MKTQPINAIRERIRQVRLELARLKMLEKLALMDSRPTRGKKGQHARQ